MITMKASDLTDDRIIRLKGKISKQVENLKLELDDLTKEEEALSTSYTLDWREQERHEPAKGEMFPLLYVKITDWESCSEEKIKLVFEYNVLFETYKEFSTKKFNSEHQIALYKSEGRIVKTPGDNPCLFAKQYISTEMVDEITKKLAELPPSAHQPSTCKPSPFDDNFFNDEFSNVSTPNPWGKLWLNPDIPTDDDAADDDAADLAELPPSVRALFKF